MVLGLDVRGTDLSTRFGSCSACVFAPSPILTITVERGPEGDEVHLHAGGQGYWVARLAASLGARVSLCAPIGGESGDVLRALLGGKGIELLAVGISEPNAVYVHDRRGGDRRPIVETPSPGLHRHELDELYGVAVAAGLASDVVLLTGPGHEHVLPAETYTRLAIDLRANGRRVLADLSGAPLWAALKGGLDVLKLSEEELRAERPGLEAGADMRSAVLRLNGDGAESVVLSRGSEPALALIEGKLLEAVGPRFAEVEAHGAGDSMFAALGVGLASGLETTDALRLAVAAGALNVARHGLGSGRVTEIDRLSRQVRISPVA
ncbi:MAG: phosphofructokinase [Thermoleophilia bacterium]|nr:phosphofructokinase [Thermoleophilia bacterium]